jgi:hypothetical protein
MGISIMGPMPQGQSKKPLPKCKALLLCEKCIIEEGTHRISLINVFDTFRLKAFPGRCPRFIAFVQLVDGIGRYRLEIEVSDLETNQAVGRTDAAIIEFATRPMKWTHAIPIRSLALPHAGMFDFVLLGDGDEIERQSFAADLATETPR